MAPTAHIHSHGHEHNTFDPGFLYKEQWIQDLIKQLQRFFATNRAWLGIEDEKAQRVLDYACGDGTVSAALVPLATSTTFQGIDIRSTQVDRFNAAAQNISAGQAKRMFAIQGDLTDPSPELLQEEWFGFNVAIISMALHHVADPVDVLKRLAQRVKVGGSIIVADWLQGLPLPSHLHNGQHHAPYDPAENHDPAQMVEVFEGERIWSGFTSRSIEECMKAAGLTNVEVRLDPDISKVPGEFRGDKQAFYAKGNVA